MLIAVCLAALVGAAEPPPGTTLAVSYEQAPEKTKKAKKDQPPKPKKAKKKAEAAEEPAPEEAPAPDEPVDPQADPAGSGWKFSWKQHPSVRYGNFFRLDVEGKMQEDGRWVYGPVKDFSTWEFHRNRFGIKGYVTKRIEYEVMASRRQGISPVASRRSGRSPRRARVRRRWPRLIA
jgi:hypothetical protein